MEKNMEANNSMEASLLRLWASYLRLFISKRKVELFGGSV